MDLSQLDLISQCEDNCSLTHIELDDVVPIEIDPQNGMLGTSCLLLIFVTYLYTMFIYLFSFCDRWKWK
jgi:hypothetical protein